jgi:hypothetical protein
MLDIDSSFSDVEKELGDKLSDVGKVLSPHKQSNCKLYYRADCQGTDPVATFKTSKPEQVKTIMNDQNWREALVDTAYKKHLDIFEDDEASKLSSFHLDPICVVDEKATSALLRGSVARRSQETGLKDIEISIAFFAWTC